MEISPCSGQWEKLFLVYLPLPLHNRYKALELKGQGHDEVNDGTSIQEESTRSGQLIPLHHDNLHLKKKKPWVIAVGDQSLILPTRPTFFR